MKRIFFLLTFVFCAKANAAGPIFRHQDPVVQQEFENVYQDIKLASLRPLDAVGSQVRHLAISVNGATQNHVRYDYIRMVDPDHGTVYVSTAGTGAGGGSLTTDITTQLDTGVAQINSFYFLYLISNGSDLRGLYSLTYTTPTIPSGYNYSMLVGAVKNDASGNFVKQIQSGDYVGYETPQVIFSTGSNTTYGTYTIYSTSGAVPGNNSDFAWIGYYAAELNCKYAAAGTKQAIVNIRTGLMPAGAIAMIDDVSWQAGAVDNVRYGTAWQFTDESTPQIRVDPVCDAGLSSTTFTLWMIGYRMKIFSVVR